MAYIYAVRSVHNDGPWKLGYHKGDLFWLTQRYGSAYGTSEAFLHACEPVDARKIEAEVHELLAEFHVEGELFAADCLDAYHTVCESLGLLRLDVTWQEMRAHKPTSRKTTRALSNWRKLVWNYIKYREAMTECEVESDIIQRFLNECCDVNSRSRVQVTTLRKSLNERLAVEWGAKKVKDNMESLGFLLKIVKINGNATRVFTGVNLKSPV
jgi:hypothetical protein